MDIAAVLSGTLAAGDPTRFSLFSKPSSRREHPRREYP